MNPFDRLERIIYHYTDLNALISILGFEHTTLWASNASFLNDSSELMQGIALINKLHPSNLKLEDFKDYYLTSFSNTEDSLVMWNHYGAHGGGCCIGSMMPYKRYMVASATAVMERKKRKIY